MNTLFLRGAAVLLRGARAVSPGLAITALILLTLGTSLAGAASTEYWIDVFAENPTAQTTPILGDPTLAPATTSATVSVPRFDRRIPGDSVHAYYLTSVSLIMHWALGGYIEVTNKDTSADHQFKNALVNIPLGITGPDVTEVSQFLSYMETATLTAAHNSAGNRVTSVTVPKQTGTASSSASNLDAYQGFGNTNAQYSILAGDAGYGGTEVSTNGHLAFGGSGTAGAILEVRYNYDIGANPLPEPATSAMIGSALLALSVILRRRKAA